MPNGSIKLQLNVDATVIAPPGGFVAADIPVVFQFNAAGQIQPNPPGVAAQIWSNRELQPQLSSTLLGTYYLVTFYDQNGAVLNATPLWWQFPETAGSTVDISQMTPVSTVGGNIIYYPTSIGGSGTVTSVAFVGDGTILSATPSTPVTVAGNLIATLLSQNANLFLAGPTTGSAAAPTFRALVAADFPFAAGGANTNVQFNSSGSLGGSSLFTWNNTLHQLTVSSGATPTSPVSIFAGTPYASLSAYLQLQIFNPASVASAGFFAYSGVNQQGMVIAYDGSSDGLSPGEALNVIAASAVNTTTTGAAIAINGEVFVTGTGSLGFLQAITSFCEYDGSNTVALMAGFTAERNVRTAGTVTVNIGLDVQSQAGVGTTNYGIRVQDQGTGANNYALYSAGGQNLLQATQTTVVLNLANATAATSGADQNSPIFQISGTGWNGAASALDDWTVQDILTRPVGVPVSTLTFTHSGIGGTPTVSFLSNLQAAGNISTVNTVTGGSGNFGSPGGPATLVITLTAAASAVGPLTTYTGTVSNQPVVGQYVTMAGFTIGANNGRFIVSSTSPTTVVVFNASGAAETHAATATVDASYINQAKHSVFFGGVETFSIAGTGYQTNAGFEALPFYPNLTFNSSGDATDAGYIRIINNGATGNHGLEIGAIIDGTGAAPVILQLGQFNGAPSAVLSTKFTGYNGLVLAGNGVPSEPFQIVATAQVANYNAGSAKTIFTPSAATILRITAVEAPGVTATGATLPSLTIGWTDVAGVARTLVLLASTSTSASSTYLNGTTDIYTNNATAVTVTSAAYAAGSGTALSYYLTVTVEIL